MCTNSSFGPTISQDILTDTFSYSCCKNAVNSEMVICYDRYILHLQLTDQKRDMWKIHLTYRTIAPNEK